MDLVDETFDVLDLLGGLGDDADLLILRQGGDLVFIGNDGVVVEVTGDPLDLDMRGLANDNGVEALTNKPGDGLVDAQDQGAAGIDHVVAHLAGGLVHRVGSTVGGDHDVGSGDGVIELVDDVNTTDPQVLDNLRIVDELPDDGELDDRLRP